jgi:hypothetical protein
MENKISTTQNNTFIHFLNTLNAGEEFGFFLIKPIIKK